MTQRKFAAFDIDGTLFRSGLYREVVFDMRRRRKLPTDLFRAAEQKHDAWMNRKGTFDDFEQALVDTFDVHLSEVSPHDYDASIKRVYARERDHVYVYTRSLLKKLKTDGYFLIAISGSQTEIVEKFAPYHGFDAWTGQVYERDGERFTGAVTKTHTGKAALLAELAAKHHLTYDDSYAIGDSNGDMGLLESVTHPIAFNPTLELRDKAMARHWPIVVERKSLAYTLKWSDAHESYLLAHTDPY